MIGGHVAGESFVLIDEALSTIDDPLDGNAAAAVSIVALGNGDTAPVYSPLEDPLISLTPFAPVHGRIEFLDSSSVTISWVRRSRGSFAWADNIDVPLRETEQRYEVRQISSAGTATIWQSSEPQLSFTASEWTKIADRGGTLEIRQSGNYGLSQPLILSIAP